MPIEARRAELNEIADLRRLYREEMRCQIVHDSIHSRPGWTNEYLIFHGGVPAGYGSVAVSGPWKSRPTLYEYYIVPQHRLGLFDLFTELIRASKTARIETQSNDPLLANMLLTFAHEVTSEAILFEDKLTTSHAPEALFRQAAKDDIQHLVQQQLDPEAKWLVSVDGTVAGAGDVLFHYNRPYGDIYMKVAEPFRQRGLGAFLVQELKRVCYEGGSVPAARCNLNNIASRKTLQKAGFVPCGHILSGLVSL